MSDNIKFNRQEIDLLLTDLLPYEKGNHYTHRHFYDYLQKEKKTLNKLFRKISKGDRHFNNKWHSAPLKFFISKKEESFRQISLINPLGLIESLAFINLFETDILNIIHNKKDFSSRKAHRTNSLTYKKDNNQTVFYTDENSKNQLLISLESSGTYFKHYPFKTITQLINSKRFIYSRDKFKYLLSIDIQDCFQSIYTHSYKWLITNKTYDSKNLKDSPSLYNNIDTFLQNLNGSKTNGILVGPEISRLLADFLFIHIDQQILEILAEKNLVYKSDYIIYRFVDDYFILTKEDHIQSVIKDVIAHVLSKYQLKINELKVTKLSKDDSLNKWIQDILPIIDKIDKIFYNRKLNFDSKKSTIISEAFGENSQAFLEVAASFLENIERHKPFRRIRYVDLRSNVITTIKNNNEKTLICSYILSTILRKIEENKSNLSINIGLNELITFIFFIYSTHVSYSSTQKTIRILSLIIEEKQDKVTEAIETNLERFEDDIFTKFPSDWIDLLLFAANYKIKLSHKLIEKISESIFLNENPVLLAALCLYWESEYPTSSFYRKVNQLIKQNLKKMNWKDFFQDELSWWVFIFKSYPKLNNSNKEFITNKLNDIKTNLNSHSSDEAKLIVLDFLNDTNRHFIEWDFTKDNYYKNYYFYTKDRTVFNPNINDLISISR
jgi:hypothetical protein